MPLFSSSASCCLRTGAGVLTAVVLGGCGTGLEAQTNEIYDPGMGVNARGGGVDALNLLVVANPDGSGTVSTALVNETEEPDQLTGVEVTFEGEPLTVDAAGLPVDIEAGKLVNLENDAPVYIQDVEEGFFLEMDLTFANAELVQVEVPVVARGEETDVYSSVPSGSDSGGEDEAEPTESTEPE